MIRATDTKAALFSLIQWEGARKAAAEKLFFFREEISSSNFRHVEIRLQVYPDSQSKERYFQTSRPWNYALLLWHRLWRLLFYLIACRGFLSRPYMASAGLKYACGTVNIPLPHWDKPRNMKTKFYFADSKPVNSITFPVTRKAPVTSELKYM